MNNEEHPLYGVWHNIKDRCRNEKVPSYGRYGGRGIWIDPMWDHFWTFVFDMGDRPPGLTIDRIDNDGPYASWNCRWATRAQQRRNCRDTVLLEKDGETLCATDWAVRLGITRSAIYMRIKRSGVVRALEPLQYTRKSGTKGQ